MPQLVKAGTTSYREYYVRILDASTGAPYTGATSATAGASFGYQRPGGTRQSISLSDLSTIDAAYSSGGIKHVGSGWYRLDLPDAALASGVNSVTVDGAFTSYVVVNPKIQLVAVDLADAVRMGLTALPNAAAGGASGLPLGDANARVGVSTIEGTDATDALLAAAEAALASTDTTVGTIAADVTTLLGRLSAARAGYLDNLSAGAVALQSTLSGIVAAVWTVGNMTDAAANRIADHVLRRSTANVEASSYGDTLGGRSLYGAVARLAHKVATALGTMTIYKSDDSASLTTATLTTDATADPVTTIDPAA